LYLSLSLREPSFLSIVFFKSKDDEVILDSSKSCNDDWLESSVSEVVRKSPPPHLSCQIAQC
ncbi:hypothetical protein, partial [Helicobacter sp. T3_23-1059]